MTRRDWSLGWLVTAAGARTQEFRTSDFFTRLFEEGKPALPVPDDPARVPAWREAAARRLREVLGVDQCSAAALAPRLVELGQRDGYRVQRVVYTSEPHADVPGLLLIPDGITETKPAPAVLCLHGNVPGAKDEVAGETTSPRVTAGLDQFHDDYARQLVRRGLVTFAIDARDCGERNDQRPFIGPAGLNWRSVTAVNALFLGRTYLGMCVFDAVRALDYLENRPEVKRDRIGCTGFSMGGTLTAWLAALDRRVKVCGISGWWGSWRARAATGEFQNMITYLPAFLRYLDLNLTVAVVTPTPMVVVHEHRDRLSEAEAFLAPVRQAYRGMKASEALRIECVPGGHVWHGEIIVPWFAQQLGLHPAVEAVNFSDARLSKRDAVIIRMKV